MLWVFGDSFAGIGCELKDKEREKKEFPYTKYTWQYQLSLHYKQPYKLLGIGGGSNHDTFKVITKYLHKIKPGDIVITVLTAPFRYLDVTQPWYNHESMSHILYNTPPSEGERLITSTLAYTEDKDNTIPNSDKDAEDFKDLIEYRRIRDGFTPGAMDAWLYWIKDYCKSYTNYFNGINVTHVSTGFGALSGAYHYDEWMTLKEDYFCDCKHFSRKGHKLNFVILRWAIENKLSYIDLKYILDNAPEGISPSLK